MASYCFLEGRYALFTEACVRGWLAAIRDFPRWKGREEAIVQAQQESETVKTEVCCIQDPEAYYLLFKSAWVSTYTSLEQARERDIVVMALKLKQLPHEEAQTVLRRGFALERVQTVVKNAWKQFVEQTVPGYSPGYGARL